MDIKQLEKSIQALVERVEMLEDQKKDLYKACKEALQIMEYHRADIMSFEIEQCKKALAKAEGKEIF